MRRITDAKARLDRLKDQRPEGLQPQDLKSMYREVMAEAERIYRQNEKAYHNLKAIRHKLGEARTLTELLNLLFAELSRRDLPHVSVALDGRSLDPEGEVFEDLPPETTARLLLVTRRDLEEALPRRGSYMGPPRFFNFEPDIKSVALVPLFLRGEVIGSLNLGSRSQTRFENNRSPDLLEDLSITAALCLDNVIAHERNRRLAAIDPLTGLYNRRYFYECSVRTLELARRHGDALALIYLDLNDFKPINDIYGHETGDRALVRTADCLRERIRRTDVAVRLGGDEFAVLLPRVENHEAVLLAAELKESLSGIDFADEGAPDLQLSAAVGVAELGPQDETIDDLLARADQAMYRDKAAHKNAG